MKKLFLIVYCLLFVSLNAKIVEIKNISEVHNHIDYKQKSSTIVLFDIDNTLTEPANDFGGDLWFSARVKNELDNGLNQVAAVEKVLPRYFEIQKNIKVKPVETKAVDVVRSLQEQKITTLALTSRSDVVLKYAYNQLKTINISFDPDFLGGGWVKLQKQKHPAFYYRGLIGCDQNSKGECFKEFVEKFKDQWPELKNKTHIIVVDDKEKYLQQVEKAFEGDSRFNITGLRYSYLDEKVKNYVLQDDSLQDDSLKHKETKISFFEKTKNKFSAFGNNVMGFFRKEKLS